MDNHQVHLVAQSTDADLASLTVFVSCVNRGQRWTSKDLCSLCESDPVLIEIRLVLVFVPFKLQRSVHPVEFMSASMRLLV